MKRRMIVAVAMGLLVVGTISMLATAAPDKTGNGAPSGAHYNLNIIGVPNPKNVDPGDYANNGHRIFVPLGGSTRIWLQEGDFAVVDYDGTDGSCKFQLPNPDPENDGITTYSVFVRGLGKPGGSATIQPGFVDESGNEWYSIATVTVERKKGKSSFVNVSKELLYVYADYDLDGTVERVPLFSNELWDFFWDYDNNGLKLCQMRFYDISTDVN
jgi:hypothetical protein